MNLQILTPKDIARLRAVVAALQPCVEKYAARVAQREGLQAFNRQLMIDCESNSKTPREHLHYKAASIEEKRRLTNAFPTLDETHCQELAAIERQFVPVVSGNKFPQFFTFIYCHVFAPGSPAPAHLTYTDTFQTARHAVQVFNALLAKLPPAEASAPAGESAAETPVSPIVPQPQPTP